MGVNSWIPLLLPKKRDIMLAQRSYSYMSDSEIIRSLKPFFEKKQEVFHAFLFGSFAGVHPPPSSDVDIGVLYRAVPNLHMIHDLAETLSSFLRKEIDLVVLNDASPVLKMQVLKRGLLLYARNKKQLHQFFVETVNQYDDLKRIRKNCEDSILRRRIYAG
jgi:predicted nucleotidyltransferase